MQAAGGAVDYDEYRRRQRTVSPAASAASDGAHAYTYVTTPSTTSANDQLETGTPGSPPPPPEQPQYFFVAGHPITYYPQGPHHVTAAAASKPTETSPKTHIYPQTAYYANNPDSHEHAWFGRTAAQVAEDNQAIAVRENVYTRTAFVPKDPKDDQLFWVVEPDGKTTVLRTFDTIDNMGWEGEWKVDHRHGNLYFERKKEEK